MGHKLKLELHLFWLLLSAWCCYPFFLFAFINVLLFFYYCSPLHAWCCFPTLREVWGRHSYSRKWNLGVLWDSRKFKTQLQESKHLALRCSLYYGTGLEVYMSKMASHELFGHMQHKLWLKEGLRAKLIVWLPTTKSWESIRSCCVQVECNTPLKSSQGVLQVCFKPRPNWRSKREGMNAQSLRSPNWDSFETPFWESRKKVSFECECGEKA